MWFGLRVSSLFKKFLGGLVEVLTPTRVGTKSQLTGEEQHICQVVRTTAKAPLSAVETDVLNWREVRHDADEVDVRGPEHGGVGAGAAARWSFQTPTVPAAWAFYSSAQWFLLTSKCPYEWKCTVSQRKSYKWSSSYDYCWSCCKQTLCPTLQALEQKIKLQILQNCCFTKYVPWISCQKWIQYR